MQSPDLSIGKSCPECKGMGCSECQAMGHRESATTNNSNIQSSQKPMIANKHHIDDEELPTVQTKCHMCMIDLVGACVPEGDSPPDQKLICEACSIRQKHELMGGKNTFLIKVVVAIIAVALVVAIVIVGTTSSQVKGLAPLEALPFEEVMELENVNMGIRKQDASVYRPFQQVDDRRRVLQHITTDKPFYKKGDIVFVEVFLVDALTKVPFSQRQVDLIATETQSDVIERISPPTEQLNDIYGYVEILDSQDVQIYKCVSQKMEHGTILYNDYRIPESLAGGEYTVKSYVYLNEVPTSVRKFRVGAYSAPALFVTADFDKNAYSVGDKVEVKVKVKRPDGSSLPMNSRITFNVGSVNGEHPLNEFGEKTFEFTVPDLASSSVLTLSVQTFVGNSNVPFPSTHSVPILKNDFDIIMVPETLNSNLIPGVENKIIFQAISIPEEVGGNIEHVEFFNAELFNNDGRIQAQIGHVHNGRSSFTFTPTADQTYTIQVVREEGQPAKSFAIQDQLPFKTDLDMNIKFTASQAVYTSDDSIEFSVLTTDSAKERNLTVIVQNKDKVIFERELSTGVVQYSVPASDLYDKATNGGVLIFRVVYSDDQKKEVANFERLIFLKPQSTIDFTIDTQKKFFDPASDVEFSVQLDNVPVDSDDEKFFTSVVVTDYSSYLKVPKHKYQPSLPTMVYLEKEVQHQNKQIDEFPYATEFLDDMFDSSMDDQTDNLDLLLAMQQWRRNLLNDIENFKSQTNQMSYGSKEQRQMEYLYGREVQPIYYYDDWGWEEEEMMFDGPMMMEAEAMMMEPMPMMADDAGGAMPEAAMNMAMDMPVPAPMPGAPAPPMEGPGPMIEMDEEIEADFADEDEGEMADQRVAGKIMAGGERKEKDEEKDEEEFVHRAEDINRYQYVKIGSRVYVHARRLGYDPDAPRVDFTQTIAYLSGAEILKSAGNYQLTQKFALNDQVSQFEVRVSVFSNKGRYGVQKKMIYSTKPQYAQFEIPQSLVQGDLLEIPITLINNDDEKSADLEVHVEEERDGTLEEPINVIPVTVGPNSQKKSIYQLAIPEGTYFKDLALTIKIFHSGDKVDSITRKATVNYNGFKDRISHPDQLGISKENQGSKKVTKTFKFPPKEGQEDGKVVSELDFNVVVYTQDVDKLLDAMKSLIRMPYGCFEQTSSSTYPMIMALRLLRKMKVKFERVGDDESLEKVKEMEADIIDKLAIGYKKLVSYHTPEGGIEWFGSAPGHEALTAYGIGQYIMFMMEDLSFVDREEVGNVITWLLGRQKATIGEFDLNPRQLDTFGGATQDLTDCYITWTLSGVGSEYLQNDDQQRISERVGRCRTLSEGSEDSYILALIGNMLFNIGEVDRAKEIAQTLVDYQETDESSENFGQVSRSKTSITSSRGRNLNVETTALTMELWLSFPADFASQSNMAFKFISSNIQGGGRYGSTQATILALRSLVKYSEVYGGLAGSGTIVVKVDGQEVESGSKEFDESENQQSAINFSKEVNDHIRKQIEENNGEIPSQVEITIEVEPYNFNEEESPLQLSVLMEVDFYNSKPPSADGSDITFTVTADKQLEDMKTVGDQMTQTISVANTLDEGMQMVVAIISVPSCMDVDPNQLSILKEQNKITYYEVSPDNSLINLYWSYVKAKEERSVDLVSTVKFGGANSVCQRRASQAYNYYNNDKDIWLM